MTDFPTFRDLPGDWIESAACAGQDPEIWFPMADPGRSNIQRAADLRRTTRLAIAICTTCPVRQRCLDFALDHERRALESIHGIYGGLRPERASRDHQEGEGRCSLSCHQG